MDRSKQGFTIVEALIVAAILAIILQLAAPAFFRTTASSRGSTAISQVRTLFALARQSATFEGEPVTVCAVDNAGVCQRDWGAGHRILVFPDRNRNAAFDAGEPEIRSATLPLVAAQLRWRASLARPYLTFDADGSTAQNGSLIYCPENGDARHARVLVISRAGRSYQTRDRDGDGIREDRNGNNVVC